MKIYFAGAESMDSNVSQLLDAGGKSIFVSYYHLTDRTRDRVRQARTLHVYNELGFRQIIDSGAFTFMSAKKSADRGSRKPGTGAGQAATAADEAQVLAHLEDYFAQYVTWVERNWSLLTDFIELDMQRLVGLVPVERWRRVLRDRGLLPKAWLVHHSCDDWAHFERIVEWSKVANGGSGHCGIEGKNLSKVGQIDYTRHARYAYEQGVCIHAFASTRAKFLSNAPLTSSDSSTWKQSSRYAVSQMYDPIHGGVISRRHREGGNVRGTGNVAVASRAWTKSLVCDATAEERIRATQGLEMESIRAFLRMERELTALWKDRGYDWDRVEEAVANEKARRP